jgi:F0F1-type ATP synthase membrane subunit c/vacuolar-type H+-ATPase subunit K
VIYIGLALLMGVGLIGFGVGGGFGGGGLLNAASSKAKARQRELLEPDQEVREAHPQQPNDV